MLPRILLVDDIESNLFLLERYLEVLNVEIDPCLYPTKVEELVKEEHYSLIVLDIQMPDINGYDLAEMIRKVELNKDTPIIFVTGVFSDNESIIKAYKSGAVDFITKPVNRTIFISKVRIFLELFNQRKELQIKSDLLEEYIKKLKNEEKRKIKYLIEGEDKERQRISRELHDGLGQYLSAASMNFASLRDEVKHLNGSLEEKFNIGNDLLRKAIEESRSITRRLIPKSVADYGLSESLTSLVNAVEKSSGIKIELISNLSQNRLGKNTEVNIFRIIQEFLNNALKHSDANSIVIQIFKDEKLLSLTYEDDGVGFNVESKKTQADSYGLQNIENRVKLMNGNLQVESESGKGTFISIELPSKTISV